MVREQDRPALRRIINAVFSIEDKHKEELRAIIDHDGLSNAEKAERYVDCIIDHLEYVEEQ